MNFSQILQIVANCAQEQLSYTHRFIYPCLESKLSKPRQIMIKLNQIFSTFIVKKYLKVYFL